MSYIVTVVALPLAMNPLRYFMAIVRGIMMKGAGIDELLYEALALAVFAVSMFSFSWFRFGKRVR